MRLILLLVVGLASAQTDVQYLKKISTMQTQQVPSGGPLMAPLNSIGSFALTSAVNIRLPATGTNCATGSLTSQCMDMYFPSISLPMTGNLQYPLDYKLGMYGVTMSWQISACRQSTLFAQYSMTDGCTQYTNTGSTFWPPPLTNSDVVYPYISCTPIPPYNFCLAQQFGNPTDLLVVGASASSTATFGGISMIVGPSLQAGLAPGDNPCSYGGVGIFIGSLSFSGFLDNTVMEAYLNVVVTDITGTQYTIGSMPVGSSTGSKIQNTIFCYPYSLMNPWTKFFNYYIGSNFVAGTNPDYSAVGLPTNYWGSSSYAATDSSRSAIYPISPTVSINFPLSSMQNTTITTGTSYGGAGPLAGNPTTSSTLINAWSGTAMNMGHQFSGIEIPIYICSAYGSVYIPVMRIWVTLSSGTTENDRTWMDHWSTMPFNATTVAGNTNILVFNPPKQRVDWAFTNQMTLANPAISATAPTYLFLSLNGLFQCDTTDPKLPIAIQSGLFVGQIQFWSYLF
jgi:hypothetical protein